MAAPLIWRAFAHPDPALRGLDAPRRRALLGQARAGWKGRTLIWVTHDLAEAMGFDRVVVMAHGKVAEGGSPADLMQQNGAFAALWRAQQALEVRLARDWQQLAVEGFQRGPHVQPSA